MAQIILEIWLVLAAASLFTPHLRENTQPGGRRAALGGSPCSATGRRSARVSSRGTASNSARV